VKFFSLLHISVLSFNNYVHTSYLQYIQFSEYVHTNVCFITPLIICTTSPLPPQPKDTTTFVYSHPKKLNRTLGRHENYQHGYSFMPCGPINSFIGFIMQHTLLSFFMGNPYSFLHFNSEVSYQRIFLNCFSVS
jgi:hypothetical protein